jgi:hypothetical protein
MKAKNLKQDAEANIWVKNDENGDWRRLHNEGLHNVYPSNIARVIKSGRLSWAGFVTRMNEGRR